MLNKHFTPGGGGRILLEVRLSLKPREAVIG